MKNKYRDVLAIINDYLQKRGTDARILPDDLPKLLSDCYAKGYSEGHFDGAVLMRNEAASYLKQVGELSLSEDVRDLILETEES